MLELRINGDLHRVDVPVGRTLAEALRDDLGLTGTKIACGEGHCGACTVQLDGVPVLSCITLVHMVGEREVTTIEGLGDHPLVDSFVRADALQCGFCTPGQIVSAAALVAAEPELTPERVRGQALFTADVALPGMLHAAVLRSPFARARVKTLDLSRARETGFGAIGPDDCHVLT